MPIKIMAMSSNKDFYEKTFQATKVLREQYNKQYEKNVIALTISGNPGGRKTFLMDELVAFLDSKGFNIIHQIEPGALILDGKEVVEYYSNKHFRD